MKVLKYLCILFGVAQSQTTQPPFPSQPPFPGFTYGDLRPYNVTEAGPYSATGNFVQQPGNRTGTVTFAIDPEERLWYYGHNYTDGYRTEEWFTPEGYYSYDNGTCTFEEHPNWSDVLYQINNQRLLTVEWNGDRLYSGYDPDYFGGISGTVRALRNGRISTENWMYLDEEEQKTSYLNVYTRHYTDIPDNLYENCEEETEAPVTEAPVTDTPTPTATPNVTATPTPNVTATPNVTETPKPVETYKPRKYRGRRHWTRPHYHSKKYASKKSKGKKHK